MNWTSISTVIFVWFLILVLSISYVYLFLPVLYEQSQTYFYGTTISCTILVLVGSISYLKAIWTSPGYPDKILKVQYVDHIDDLKRRAEQQKQFKNLRKKNKLTRQINIQQVSHLLQDSWCQKCDNVKQARAHHCKICKTCIERMDHHCPWVGNCIGKHNHKYFILFLFYKTIALAIVSFTILIDYIDSESPILTRIYQKDELYYIIILVTGMMSIMLFMAIGFLLTTQIMMIGQNLTTLQTFYDEIRQNNPFDKDSFIQNVKEITGQSFWFLPTKPFPSHQDQINVAFTQQG